MDRIVAALECDYDRLEELREERDEHDSAEDIAEGNQWHFENPDEAKELEELEEEAGECANREDAEKQIHEDALSVEVRSDWHSPGESGEPTEFRIVLCTGGPHVEIRGELSQGEPSRAWLVYSGWFMSATERVNKEGDQEALLAYARCFYFSE